MLLDRDAVRTFEVKVRLSVREFQKLRSLATEQEVSLAAVVRALALQAARESAALEHDVTERSAA